MADEMLSGGQKIERSVVTATKLIELLQSIRQQNLKDSVVSEIDFIENFKNVIHMFEKTNSKIYISVYHERIIRTFYNGRLYKVIHPNTIAVTTVSQDRISEISLFPFNCYRGFETRVFMNPYPNTYSSNKVCIGSLDREFKGNLEAAITGIVEGTYTHSNTGFKDKGLVRTEDCFKYLSRHPFPYEHLVEHEKIKTVTDLIADIKEKDNL